MFEIKISLIFRKQEPPCSRLINILRKLTKNNKRTLCSILPIILVPDPFKSFGSWWKTILVFFRSTSKHFRILRISLIYHLEMNPQIKREHIKQFSTKWNDSHLMTNLPIILKHTFFTICEMNTFIIEIQLVHTWTLRLSVPVLHNYKHME